MQTATHHDALSRFGYALSDPTRAEILLILRDGPGYPSDLADQIGVSRQILSNHLACLPGGGLVVAQRSRRRAHASWPSTRPAAPPPRPTPAADVCPARDASRNTATPNPAAGRRNDHLQRDRGGRRVGRRQARRVVGADRLRARLGRRDLVGGRGGLAVLRH